MKNLKLTQWMSLAAMVAVAGLWAGCDSGRPKDQPRRGEAAPAAQPEQGPKTSGTATEQVPPQAPPEEGTSAGGEPAKLVAIAITLPAPKFRGTPVPLKEPNVEKPLGGPRPPFLAPEGTVNLALGKPVRSSDPAPVSGDLDLVTDGDKEATDWGVLTLDGGTQWVQIDLEKEATIYAVLMWHDHNEARVYRDVIVQVGNDPDFLDAVTVFNNDYDNSSGMGLGKDLGYVETSEGKLIDCRGVQGRYVRISSRGNSVNPQNHYTEVEVYGK